MEAKNHPIEKENHLPNLHFWVPCFSFFQGVKALQNKKQRTPSNSLEQ